VIIASQSVKTTYVGGTQRGFNGGKKVKDRKRPMVVDTQGLVLAPKVHAADISDRDGAPLVLEQHNALDAFWKASNEIRRPTTVVYRSAAFRRLHGITTA
jgi:hypothetical protein